MAPTPWTDARFVRRPSFGSDSHLKGRSKFQEPNSNMLWRLVLGIWFLEFGSWNLVLGIWFLNMTAFISGPAIREGIHKGKLTGQVVPRQLVDQSLTDRLFELFARYYQQVDRVRFDRDQSEKDWVLLLFDAQGAVQGFTTLKVCQAEVLGRQIRAVFSGNTIIAPDFWGEQELVATWCRFMARLKLERSNQPLYWFLICSGYRTYLYLHLFFHEFFPRYDRPTPEFERELIDSLGRMKFPEEYRQGIVHVSRPRECLAAELAQPRPAKHNNPHVRFFFERNPGCCQGDELVCVTEFSLENTKRLAHVMAQEVLT